MSHIYDRNTAYTFPALPYSAAVTAGACTFVPSKTGVLWYLRCLAGAGGAQIEVQQVLRVPQALGVQKGFNLRQLDVWYYCGAPVTSLDVAVYLATFPADGAAFGAPAVQAFTYDADHDEEVERATVGYQKMTLSITRPPWVLSTQYLQFKYLVELGANGSLYVIASRARGYFRL